MSTTNEHSDGTDRTREQGVRMEGLTVKPLRRKPKLSVHELAELERAMPPEQRALVAARRAERRLMIERVIEQIQDVGAQLGGVQ